MAQDDDDNALRQIEREQDDIVLDTPWRAIIFLGILVVIAITTFAIGAVIGHNR